MTDRCPNVACDAAGWFPRNGDDPSMHECPACGATWEAARPSPAIDAEALDELNLLLSAPVWPGASGMEDVCQIVRATGRKEVPDAPAWGRH